MCKAREPRAAEPKILSGAFRRGLPPTSATKPTDSVAAMSRRDERWGVGVPRDVLALRRRFDMARFQRLDDASVMTMHWSAC
jgi:hypothetical protein